MAQDAAVLADARLAGFVYHEARLLDEQRFDEWYALLTPDIRYWMPLARDQSPQPTQTSLFDEDALLLKVRIERLKQPNAFSQQQPSFCQHVLQQPTLEESDVAAGRFVLRTPFLYVESQLDQQLLLAGVAYHHLTSEGGRLRIRLKRLELLNRDAALPSIQLLL